LRAILETFRSYGAEPCESRSPAEQYWLPRLPRQFARFAAASSSRGHRPRRSKDAATRTSATVNARR